MTLFLSLDFVFFYSPGNKLLSPWTLGTTIPTDRLFAASCLTMTKLENITLIIITIPLMWSPLCLLWIVRLGGYTVNLLVFYFYKLIGKLTTSFAPSGVQIAQHHRGQFHYRRTTFSSQLKSKIGNILTKSVVLRINLNIDVAPVTSRSHTHPSHSQTSCLLTSSLSSGVPVPRVTQCMWDV